MAKKKSGRLRRRYKALRAQLKQKSPSKSFPDVPGPNSIELKVSERSIWPVLIHIVAKSGGKCERAYAYAELLKIVPFTEEYRSRIYATGEHVGTSVIEHHWGFLRGQANEKTKGWHEVMKPANQTEADSFELTDFGKALASGMRPLVESFLRALKQGKITVYVE